MVRSNASPVDGARVPSAEVQAPHCWPLYGLLELQSRKPLWAHLYLCGFGVATVSMSDLYQNNALLQQHTCRLLLRVDEENVYKKLSHSISSYQVGVGSSKLNTKISCVTGYGSSLAIALNHEIYLCGAESSFRKSSQIH
jgi:hypothetical protein